MKSWSYKRFLTQFAIVTIFVLFTVDTTSALVCPLTGKIECNRLLGLTGGCPLGRLCSIANCCETLLESILLKNENQASPTLSNATSPESLEKPKNENMAVKAQIPIASPLEFVSVNLAFTVCQNATCVSHTDKKQPESTVAE